MYCYVWLPSSLLPASFQHPYSILVFPASFQPPYSILTASSQHHSSLNHQYFLIHRCIDHLSVFVHMCIGNQSCLIYIYMCVCIHHSSSLITYMHWSSICMVGLSHTHVQCLFCFACPELMLVHCQLTPRMSTQCALHYTCTLCHVTDLYLLNCIYMISTT